MDVTEVAQRYFDAWNHRDAAAIVAAFTERGTYSDPVAGQGLTPVKSLSLTRRRCGEHFPTFPTRSSL